MAAGTREDICSDRTHLIEVLLEGSTGRALERRPTATEVAFALQAWVVMLDLAAQLLADGVPAPEVEGIHRRVWLSCEGAPWLDLLRIVASVYLDVRELEGTER